MLQRFLCRCFGPLSVTHGHTVIMVVVCIVFLLFGVATNVSVFDGEGGLRRT